MWLKPQGYAVITQPGEPAIARLDGLRCELVQDQAQFDTATCGHCGRVFHVGARQHPSDIGGLCKVCYRIICPRCLDQGCSPLERKLEEAERRDIALRSYGL